MTPTTRIITETARHMEQPDIATQLGSIESALLAILAVLQEGRAESDTLRRHLLRQLDREASGADAACVSVEAAKLEAAAILPAEDGDVASTAVAEHGVDMVWSTPRTGGGATVSPEHQQAAWDGWRQQGYGRASALTRWLEFAVADERDASPNYYPIADKMLQRARKAGAIRFNGRVWEPVPGVAA